MASCYTVCKIQSCQPPRSLLLQLAQSKQAGTEDVDAGGYYGTTVATNPTYQVYNPRTKALGPERVLTQLQATSPANLSPFVAVLPSQRVVVTAYQQTQLYTYDSTNGTLTPATTVLPQLPIPVSAPYSVSPAVIA